MKIEAQPVVFCHPEFICNSGRIFDADRQNNSKIIWINNSFPIKARSLRNLMAPIMSGSNELLSPPLSLRRTKSRNTEEATFSTL